MPSAIPARGVGKRDFVPLATDYGVVGNGTDVSVALKAMHDALATAGHRYAWFPPGTYYAPTATNLGDVIFVGPGVLSGAYRKHIIPFHAGHKHILGEVSPAHLTRFHAASAPNVHVVGDSTIASTRQAAVIPASWSYANANNTGKLEGLYGRLKTAILRAVPSKTVTFRNYGIGGTAWSDALGSPSSPPYWYDSGGTWDDYYLADSPDLIIAHWGTNNAAGTTAAHLTDWLAAVEAIDPVPSVVLVTPYGRSRMVSGDVEATEINARDNVAELIRTFARVNGLGLVDLHRQATLARDGFDPCLWTMELQRGVMGSTQYLLYNFPEETVDFELGVTFAAGTTTIPDGGRALDVAIGANVVYNYVRLSNAGGKFAVQVNLENGLTQFGSAVVTDIDVPSGSMSLTWTMRGGHLLIETYESVGGDQYANRVIWEGQVIRHGGLFTPRLKLSDNSAALSFTLDMLTIGRPTLFMPEVTDAEAWGYVDGGTISTSIWGGNDINHPAAFYTARVAGGLVDRTSFAA